MVRYILLMVFLFVGCQADVFDGSDADPNDAAGKDVHVIVLDAALDGDAPSFDASGADGGGDGGASADSGDGGAPSKRVFITSSVVNSNFGGLTQGDALCQACASDAGLPGTYRAWLSSSGMSAASRLTHSSGSYVRTDGVIVADDWSGIIGSAPLKSAIDHDEHGSYVPYDTTTFAGSTWTGTATDGGYTGQACADWTVSEVCTTVSYYGTSGIDSFSSSAWTSGGSSGCCTVQFFSLYCFEQ